MAHAAQFHLLLGLAKPTAGGQGLDCYTNSSHIGLVTETSNSYCNRITNQSIAWEPTWRYTLPMVWLMGMHKFSAYLTVYNFNLE